MKTPLIKIYDEAQNIKLSSHEKAVIRARLFEMVRRSATGPAVSKPKRSPYFLFAPRFAMSFGAILLLLLGSTTAFAAQSSLPGQVLYPVKIHVNESVQEMLAVSDSAKVSFHTSIAQERLKEAEALASEGRLDATTTQQIESDFEDHAGKADILAADLEDSDPAAGVEAKIALDSSISAHGAILARIGGSSDDQATRNNSNLIANRVRSRGHEDGESTPTIATAAMMAPASQEVSDSGDNVGTSAETHITSVRIFHEASTSITRSKSMATTTDSSGQIKTASQLQQKAVKQLAAVRNMFTNAQASLDASTSAQVESQFATLEDKLTDGAQQMGDGQYDSARTSFTDVLRGSVELGTRIDASRLYKRDLVRVSRGEDDRNVEDVGGPHGGGEVRGVSTENVVPPALSTMGSDKKGQKGKDGGKDN